MIEVDKLYKLLIKSYARCILGFRVVWFFLFVPLGDKNMSDVGISRKSFDLVAFDTTQKKVGASLVII